MYIILNPIWNTAFLKIHPNVIVLFPETPDQFRGSQDIQKKMADRKFAACQDHRIGSEGGIRLQSSLDCFSAEVGSGKATKRF